VASDSTALNQTHITSPTASRRAGTSSSAGNSYIAPPGFPPAGGAGGAGAAAIEYPDLQTMEFLQGLQGGAPNGEFAASMDQAQLDLGFGINWDGMHHDFSEGQQVNLFDGFFFGGQQGGMNGGGGMGGL
jgi:hypothetical protein